MRKEVIKMVVLAIVIVIITLFIAKFMSDNIPHELIVIETGVMDDGVTVTYYADDVNSLYVQYGGGEILPMEVSYNE